MKKIDLCNVFVTTALPKDKLAIKTAMNLGRRNINNYEISKMSLHDLFHTEFGKNNLEPMFFCKTDSDKFPFEKDENSKQQVFAVDIDVRDENGEKIKWKNASGNNLLKLYNYESAIKICHYINYYHRTSGGFRCFVIFNEVFNSLELCKEVYTYVDAMLRLHHLDQDCIAAKNYNKNRARHHVRWKVKKEYAWMTYGLKVDHYEVSDMYTDELITVNENYNSLEQIKSFVEKSNLTFLKRELLAVEYDYDRPSPFFNPANFNLHLYKNLLKFTEKDEKLLERNKNIFYSHIKINNKAVEVKKILNNEECFQAFKNEYDNVSGKSFHPIICFSRYFHRNNLSIDPQLMSVKNAKGQVYAIEIAKVLSKYRRDVNSYEHAINELKSIPHIQKYIIDKTLANREIFELCHNHVSKNNNKCVVVKCNNVFLTYFTKRMFMKFLNDWRTQLFGQKDFSVGKAIGKAVGKAVGKNQHKTITSIEEFNRLPDFKDGWKIKQDKRCALDVDDKRIYINGKKLTIWHLK